MSVAARLDGKRVCVCTGSGGVGKTTVAAAVALGLAAAGRRVAVVTIDPAQRLAGALGLDALGNDPQRVDPARLAGVAVRGELWAMMLDPKRTFDDLIEQLAPDAAAREAILGNAIYRHLSSAVAGSQEFTAIAKLYELERSGRFDVIVLDTPPSRNALDFFDAPERLTALLQGRTLRFITAPTGAAATVAARGSGLIFSLLRRITGVELLDDLGAFFLALSGAIDGFTQRAVAVGRLLADPATTFLIVAAPEPAPVQEAIFLHRRLRTDGLPFGGAIVNRVRVLAARPAAVDERALAESLGGDTRLAGRALRTLSELRALAARDAAGVARLARELGDDDPIVIPQLERDVHDIDGLATVARFLFATPRERRALLAAEAF